MEKFTITINVEDSRHDYYPNSNGAGCRRCAFYAICAAISNMQEKHYPIFVETSERPCKQNVKYDERKYIKLLVK